MINGKPALDMYGDWALMQSSSGKQYFFNVKVCYESYEYLEIFSGIILIKTATIFKPYPIDLNRLW